MTTYDVLVSDELLSDFIDNPLMPDGFRIIGPVEGPGGYRSTRVQVEDDNAPEWTEGQLVEPIFTSHYEDGKIARVTITEYLRVDEEERRISRVVQQAEDSPGETFEADR
ncbi:MAG TPA: hypothetical protein VFR23_18175 [Jiangellaceae bacterium]|nr:hypothetical protein [Jiangellaceae bacterium]